MMLCPLDHLLCLSGKLSRTRASSTLPPAERPSSQGPGKEQRASATPTLKLILRHFDMFSCVLPDSQQLGLSALVKYTHDSYYKGCLVLL